MTGVRWAAALLGLALAAPPLLAQRFFIASPAPYYGFPPGGAVIGFGGHHGHVAFSLGGYYGPGFGPYGFSSNQVTVVIASPPTPTVVFVPYERPDLDEQLQEALRQSLRDDQAPPDRPPQGEQRFGGFKKVEPPAGRRAQPPELLQPPAPVPQPPAQPPAPPPLPKLPPAPPPAAPPQLPEPPAPLGDPKAEYDRVLGLGRTAFADLQYGRAADRFRQAAALQPNQPMPHFLLAETLLAQGKYHDAVDAIRAGMALQPDWPDAHFQPRDLYGPHAADYADHLKDLQDALDRRPADPDLLFLYGYALWFDGRKDDARPLFQKALPFAADPAMVHRFLRAAAGPAAQ